MLRLRDYAAEARIASGIDILLGSWLILSPWLFDCSAKSATLSSVTAGVLIALLAAIRVASVSDSAGLSGIDLILAFWIVASPWVYEYATNAPALMDHVVVGVLVALLAILERPRNRCVSEESQTGCIGTLTPG